MPKRIENPTPEQLHHRKLNKAWWDKNKDRILKERRDKNAAERKAKGLPPFTRKKSVKKKTEVAPKKTPRKKATKAQAKKNHKERNIVYRERLKKEKQRQEEIDRKKRIDEYNKQFK